MICIINGRGLKIILDLVLMICIINMAREGVQRHHDPRKNDLRASGFAELPPGPAKLISQPP